MHGFVQLLVGSIDKMVGSIDKMSVQWTS